MSPILNEVLCIFDLETGGLDLHHPVIQFAGVAVDRSWRELETLQVKIQFNEADCEPKALEINHYDSEVWAREAVSKLDAVMRISSFLSRHKCIRKISKRNIPYRVAKLCGHNAKEFDFPRLQKMFADVEQFLPADFRVRDTLALALWWFDAHGIQPPDNTFRLGPLCKFFGIEPPAGEATHDALTDVRMTVRLARYLMEGINVGTSQSGNPALSA